MRVYGLIFFGGAILGCGTSDPDTGDAGPGDAAPTDGGGKDSGKDTGVDASTCSGTCAPTVPTGWTIVAYDGANRNPCPAEYATSSDWLESPMGADAVCTCTFGVQTPPTCAVQQASLIFTADAMCASNTQVSSLTMNTCTTQTLTYNGGNNGVWAYGKASTMKSGGACTTPQPTKMSVAV